MTTWTLMDYGVGNLHSLQKGLEAVGAKTAITRDVNQLAEADIAVLPGVGAFGHVMQSLAPGQEALAQRHRDGRPIFGVCIGMQVLFAGSQEDPGSQGLGILDGQVQALPAQAGKIPHMGWNTVEAPGGGNLAGAVDGKHVYYVHSYAAPVIQESIATTQYGDAFCAALHAGNTVASQFHPEKSSTVGRNFLQAVRSELEAA